MSTYEDYSGQVVLITGAGSGIGKEAALQFGERGAKLAISDINASSLNDITEILKNKSYTVYTQVCDVANEEQVKSFINNSYNHFGRIDAGVNNAGIDPDHNFLVDIPVEDYEKTIDVNVKGVFLCMKYQIPHMIKHGGGAICNVASVAGVSGIREMSVYSASKHAVVGLTKSVAMEYGKQNVRVNAVCPYVTLTNLIEPGLQAVPDREQALKHLAKGTAVKRVAEAAEIVKAIIFACDKDNSYMTGHELVIDGGATA